MFEQVLNEVIPEYSDKINFYNVDIEDESDVAQLFGVKSIPQISMIRNIATEHWRSLKAFVKGEQVITTQEEAERRWEICKGCEFLLYDQTNPDTNKKDGRCSHCACFMNVKVHYAVAECPIGKWGKYEKSNKK